MKKKLEVCLSTKCEMQDCQLFFYLPVSRLEHEIWIIIVINIYFYFYCYLRAWNGQSTDIVWSKKVYVQPNLWVAIHFRIIRITISSVTLCCTAAILDCPSKVCLVPDNVSGISPKNFSSHQHDEYHVVVNMMLSSTWWISCTVKLMNQLLFSFQK